MYQLFVEIDNTRIPGNESAPHSPQTCELCELIEWMGQQPVMCEMPDDTVLMIFLLHFPFGSVQQWRMDIAEDYAFVLNTYIRPVASGDHYRVSDLHQSAQ